MGKRRRFAGQKRKTAAASSAGTVGEHANVASHPRAVPAHVVATRSLPVPDSAHRSCDPALPSPTLANALLAAALLCSVGADSAWAGERIAFDDAGVARGTILIRTAERRLYFVLGAGMAMAYPVGVGRADRQWVGASTITGKYVRTNWAPPAAVKRDKPNLPDLIPGGAPNNPLGVAAMTLAGGEYAIHGTNRPNSIGGFVSYGCIRMTNADIVDLYDRVRVGTPVLVTR